MIADVLLKADLGNVVLTKFGPLIRLPLFTRCPERLATVAATSTVRPYCVASVRPLVFAVYDPATARTVVVEPDDMA
jgi:hypothetical protein